MFKCTKCRKAEEKKDDSRKGRKSRRERRCDRKDRRAEDRNRRCRQAPANENAVASKPEKENKSCLGKRLAGRGMVAALVLVAAGAVMASRTAAPDEADQILIKRD